MASGDERPFWGGQRSLVGGEDGAPEGTPLCRDALEVEFCGELGLAGRLGGTDGAGAARESVGGGVKRLGKRTSRIVELGVVEDVVGLHAELQFADAVTREVEVLGQDQVGVVDPGTVLGVA
jgi:hypothetical protein